MAPENIPLEMSFYQLFFSHLVPPPSMWFFSAASLLLMCTDWLIEGGLKRLRIRTNVRHLLEFIVLPFRLLTTEIEASVKLNKTR